MALGPSSDRICFTSPVVLTHQPQNHLGTIWVGAEGRDYQRVIKMFIINRGDGFMVHAYVKTNQIAYFKQVLFTVCQLHFNKTMEKKESPGGSETFHF